LLGRILMFGEVSFFDDDVSIDRKAHSFLFLTKEDPENICMVFGFGLDSTTLTKLSAMNIGTKTQARKETTNGTSTAMARVPTPVDTAPVLQGPWAARAAGVGNLPANSPAEQRTRDVTQHVLSEVRRDKATEFSGDDTASEGKGNKAPTVGVPVEVEPAQAEDPKDSVATASGGKITKEPAVDETVEVEPAKAKTNNAPAVDKAVEEQLDEAVVDPPVEAEPAAAAKATRKRHRRACRSQELASKTQKHSCSSKSGLDNDSVKLKPKRGKSVAALKSTGLRDDESNSYDKPRTRSGRPAGRGRTGPKTSDGSDTDTIFGVLYRGDSDEESSSDSDASKSSGGSTAAKQKKKADTASLPKALFSESSSSSGSDDGSDGSDNDGAPDPAAGAGPPALAAVPPVLEVPYVFGVVGRGKANWAIL
jgi:hypothetical protein